MVTETRPPATIKVTRTPAIMVAGEPFTLKVATTNAAKVYHSCTSTGTGYTRVGGYLANVNEETTGIASADWVGYPSSCLWLAYHADGTYVVKSETMTTHPSANAGPPTLEFTTLPAQLISGQGHLIAWKTTNAASLSYTCGNNAGYSESRASVPLNSSMYVTGKDEWIANPPTCTWTVAGPGGEAKQTYEMKTVIGHDAVMTNHSGPTNMLVNATGQFTVTVTNSGNTTWTSAFHKLGIKDNAGQDIKYVSLSRDVAPGESYTFSSYLSAPANPGTTSFKWQMYWQVQTGGGGVNWYGQEGQSDPITVVDHLSLQVERTSSLVVGQPFSISWATKSAARMDYSCTNTAGAMPATGSSTEGLPMNAVGGIQGIVPEAWRTSMPICTWYAYRADGTYHQYSDFMKTVAPDLRASPVSVEMNDSVVADKVYLVKVTMTNTGEATWKADSGVSLASLGTLDGGVTKAPLPQDVPPAHTVVFEIWPRAPAKPGVYSAQWQMIDGAGTPFGDPTVSRSIEIVPLPTLTLNVQPDPLVANQPFKITWTTTDATSVSYTCRGTDGRFYPTRSFIEITQASSIEAVASELWIENPPRCDWTVHGPNGQTAYYDQPLITQLNASVGARLVRQGTLPARVSPGQVFRAELVFLNSGSVAWQPGVHRLISKATDATGAWGVTEVQINQPVAPGSEYTFVINATAPSTLGPKSFNWGMNDGTSEFGAIAGATIDVVPGPNIDVVLQPAPLVAGEPFNISWSSTNADSVDYVCSVEIAPGVRTKVGAELQNAAGISGVASASWIGAATPVCDWIAKRDGLSQTRQVKLLVELRGDETGSGNHAQFVDQSVPTSIAAGSAVTVKIRMKNTGTATWLPGTVVLLPVDGHDSTTWVVGGKVDLPVAVAPGATHEFTFLATAPLSAGTYQFKWSMGTSSGLTFGEASLEKSIAVTAASAANLMAKLYAAPQHSRVAAGATTQVTLIGEASALGNAQLKRLHLLQDKGDGFKLVASKDVASGLQGMTQPWPFDLPHGLYRF
jgi:hypothetical protein